MLLLKRAFQVKCFSEEWLGEAGQQRLRRLEMRLWWELQVISHFSFKIFEMFREFNYEVHMSFPRTWSLLLIHTGASARCSGPGSTSQPF